jgi:deoxyribodipyrimidine photo-lyase
VNDAPERPEAEFVVYWMTAFRRLGWNFSLDRAVERAVRLGKPLIILEALRLDYPWASDRLHDFVLGGMADNLDRAASHPVLYYPYVEPAPGAGRGLLETLASRAAIVVTDDYPGFFHPNMMTAAGSRMDTRLEAVDSNGLLPLRATDRVFARAVDFRRFLQKVLPPHLHELPRADALARTDIPVAGPGLLAEVRRRWPAVEHRELTNRSALLASLDIDHTVGVPSMPGGPAHAERRWRDFLGDELSHYAEGRNDPDSDASSRLSPYLHFGHLSSHQVFSEVARRELWTPLNLAAVAKGQRSGWWGMSPEAEAFLDQIVTWRELGYNMSAHGDRSSRFESLPDWARRTIDEHRSDPRPFVYTLEELETARTHDEIWNAAQRQLVRDGRIHNYLRMLWGKKIFEWTETPEEALHTMFVLNDKYALDGRDPNSDSGIFWCLGRYDRAWGPERPVFGKIRYMSSDNTRRKLSLDGYLKAFGPEGG